MKNNITSNRHKLYDRLFKLGYFVDEKGNTELSYNDFEYLLQDKNNVVTLYENLISEELLLDNKGESVMSLDEFLYYLCGYYNDRDYYPLTNNQLGLYLDWEQHRDSLQYNVPIVIKLKGYDAKRLQAAVSDVVAVHPYFFAQLAKIDGEVRIKRNEPQSYQCAITELEEEPATEFFQSRVRPFNLLDDRLFRFEIFTYGETTYLFKDIHHIITDGVSDALLMTQIFAIYNGETIGAETYTAYDRALEEQEIKESPAYTEASAYYKNLLSGVESTVYPHSADNLGCGKAQYVHSNLNRNTIETLCANLGVTPSNYLLTVFMEVLKRITHEERVLITTVNSGREHAAMQSIQGFFVKTLPVVSENTMAEVQKQLLESINHECYPLTEMVQYLGIHPEIMFVFEGGLFDEDWIREIKDLKIIPLALDTTKVPLTLTVNPDKEDYELSIEYDDALYNELDMQTLLHSIIVLAENYAKETSVSLQDCSMLTEDEEQRLIELGTGERLDYDESKTFIDLFKEQVAKTPDAVAVVDYCSKLTYNELDEASDNYAKGITSGTFVCLEMPRVKEFVTAVIGIWKAGSAYVPIDTEYPEERKRFMREECDGKPLPQATIAYMIYTSGSTGQPKGVMVQHAAISAFVAWRSRMLGLKSDSRIAHYSNFAFDASLDDLLCPLAAGSCILLMPEKTREDIRSIHDYLVDNQVTGLTLPTRVGQLLQENYTDLNLDYLMMGGEALIPCPINGTRLINGYGPTEFTVCSSYYELEGNEKKNVPIGHPVPNSQAYICDPNGKLLPLGVAGELCLAGVQMAIGYWNDPELTAERFIEISTNGKQLRVYKTGDLCRWNSKGQLEYIGRIDNQIKLRGYRIELGEIESVVLKIEGINQAVAVIRNDQIILYYISEKKSLIKGDLEGLLPAYMLPGIYMHLEAIPLTRNGKVDYQSLPEPEMIDDEYVAPRMERERIIAKAFKEVLLLNTEVSITSNFYGLGGDSIKAMRLVSKLANQGYSLSVSDVMKQQTPAALAKTVLFEEKEQEDDKFILPVTKRYPLTPMQESMLLKHLSEPDSWGYRLVSQYKLNLIPTEAQLRSALDALAIEHETLRTRIIYKNVETPEQEITDREIPVSIEDIRESDRTIEEIRTEQLNKGFDLEEDSLMRVVCIVTADNECLLLIAIHHIITDGWSLPIYLSHFILHLKDAIEGKEIDIADSDAGMFEQHVRSLQIRDKDESLLYWHDLLAGYETKAEISSYESPKDNEEVNDHLSVALSKDVTEKLKTVCIENNATLSHATELAWGIVLQRYTRQDDVVFAKVVSCRDKAPMDMSHVVGPFINSIPVRIKTDNSQTIGEALKSVSQQAAESNPHDYCSMSEIQQQSELGSNLFQSILAFENYPVSEDIKSQFSNEHDGVFSIEPLDNQEESFNDITLSSYEKDGKLHLELTFDKTRFTEQEMQQLLSSWNNVLTKVAVSPQAKIKDVSLLKEEEQQRIIELGTGEKLEYDKSKTFIDLFKEQVARTPDSVAVVDATSQLTYRELDIASDEYAKTVTPGTFVCLELPRVKEFVVAVLGIWKAGAAYVPIDMEYPEERKRFMREECDGKPLPQTDIAYMIYTSGSTGKPKGVMIQHSALMNFIMFQRATWPLHEGSRVACHTNFAFDASLKDLYAVLTKGGTLHIISEGLRRDIPLLRQYFAENKITGVNFATAFGNLFCQDAHLDLEYISFGGERMTFTPDNTGLVFNTYGPTETTIDVTYIRLDKNDDSAPIPIGKPIPNNQCFILDQNQCMLPHGASGESCVAGPQLALGYWNNQELTDERFVEITLNGKKERIYKTGDLCRWNRKGQLEYIGRIDNQIKLRGYRIELGEIESAALQMEGIKQTVAIVKNDQIVLYYTGEHIISETEFSTVLTRTLAHYMIPSVFVQLDTLPLTTNGKIDRAALPEIAFSQKQYIAPRNETERVIVETIKNVLVIQEDVSITSSFYSLGGDSIKSMRLVSLLSQKGLRISVADVMKLQTPKALSVIAESIRAEEEDFTFMLPVSKHYPLTPLQEAMLLKHITDTESTAYRLVYRHKIGVVPTEAQLRAALHALTIEHETLRTRIKYKDVEVPEQEITDREIPLSIEEIRATGRTLEEIHDEQLKKGFDLQEDSLIRVVCIITGECECQLLFAMHHIITDGWSTPIIFSHFLQYLKQAIEGDEIVTDDSEAGMFELHVRSLLMRDKDASLSYWHDLLEGYDTKAEIVPHRDGNEIPVDVNDHLSCTLNFEQTKKLKSVCAECNATMSHATELAWGIVLQRYTHLEDVVFAKVVSCRDKAPQDMSHVVGPFINSIPVRVKNEGRMSLSYSLQQLSQQAAESNAHDYCSLSEIQQQNKLGSNLFQSILAFENYPIAEEVRQLFDDAAASLGIEEQNYQEESYNDIALTAYETNGQLSLNLTFDKEKFVEQDMKSLLFAWQYVLLQIADTPSQEICKVRLITEEEEKRLVALGTGDRLDYDKTKSFIDLFKEQVLYTPHAIALVDATSHLTYKELDEASDKYAKTVIPGTFVCLELPRVKEFVVAVLGIWKAGSAYVPIDMEYPEERKYLIRQECDGKPLPSQDVAYMIYTSGSTGMPKGVMICHKGLTNYIHSTIAINGILSSDRISAYRSFSFDSHIEEFYPTLAVGATVYIIPEAIRQNLAGLHAYLQENHITGCYFPTSVATLLYDNYELPVRFIGAVGEKLMNVVSGKNGVQFINTYGPTECTDHISVFVMKEGENYANIPIGRPLHNGTVIVVDTYNHLVPEGCVGELCFSSVQLALGYYDNEKLTSEKFVEITIGNKKERFYKTGDLCRWNKDGQLEYIGRIDNQVKLRGFRIELGEIENAALKVNEVEQAVAAVKNEQIILYYVASNQKDLTSSLSVALSSTLANYMIPSIYMKLDKLPLTPNGKIDRKALPIPEQKEREYVAPSNEAEQLIAEAFQQVLELQDPVSVTDSFSVLGGDSIRAMRLELLLYQKGVKLSVAQILKIKTPQALAREIVDFQARDTAEEAYHFDVQEYYPIGEICYPQIAHFLRINYGDTAQVNSNLVIAGTDVLRLKRAVYRVLKKHPYLKTHIVIHENQPMWHRDDSRELEIAVEHVDSWADISKDVKPLQLLNSNLTRITIYVSKDEMLLKTDFSHLIMDGLALKIYAQEIRRAFDEPDAPFEQQRITGYDMYAWEQEWLEHNHQHAEKHFDSLFSGVTDVPFPHSKELDEGHPSAMLAKRVGNGEQIRQFCKAHDFTVNSYLQTAMTCTLLHIIQQDKLLMHCVSANRSRLIKDVLCNRAKPMPLVGFSQWLDQEPYDVIREIEIQYGNTLQYEPYPIHLPGSNYRRNMFFIYISEVLSEIGSIDENTHPFPPYHKMNHGGVMMHLSPYLTLQGNYYLTVIYNGDLYSQKDMQLLLDTWCMLAENLCVSSGPIKDIFRKNAVS